MRSLVVFESLWGNTEIVARAIAEGLAPLGEVDVVDVTAAPAVPQGIDLVVAGGPTHAFSLSRPSTRESARHQGADHGSAAFGLREWLQALPAGQHSERIATFDTRIEKTRYLPGSAAVGAVRIARKHGFEAVGHSESFFVEAIPGPLIDGEIERARAWGADLGHVLASGSKQ
jgi:menaquinone-dependent protoporphyrinogen IX oxidase